MPGDHCMILGRQKHNSEIIENEIENVELGALLLLCFVINMNFCKLTDCVIFSHTFVRFAFYCLILGVNSIKLLSVQ